MLHLEIINFIEDKKWAFTAEKDFKFTAWKWVISPNI